jgi:uncharacterized protein (DUF1684 family)
MLRFSNMITAALLACSPAVQAVDLGTERSSVEEWRAQRVADLTSDQGWLTLAGLFWLEEGANTFGRGAANRLVLDHPALPDFAGSFLVASGHVEFTARAGSGITQDGVPISKLDLVSDAHASPTVLASGPLRFFVIERAGRLGVRVRDLNSPRRRNFRAIDYFPVSRDWVLEARFEPYVPHRHVKIVNILGMEEEMESPGALIFQKAGRVWRLDAFLEDSADSSLFVMFADATSGKQTYGAGRFIRAPLPASGTTRLDFNKAYNPPCAFNDFATCPLPPYQNRLALAIEAGERKYASP